MAGQVPTRLFDLLPPLMPLSEKFCLAENLWRHIGPRSKCRLRIGLDATVEDVVAKIREHIDDVVNGYVIPDRLTQRFNWLAAGDVGVKAQILNHLQTFERKLILENARQYLSIMFHDVRRDPASHTVRLARILTVGKYELELLIDRNTSGVSLEKWKPQISGGGRLARLWWVILIVGAVVFIALRN